MEFNVRNSTAAQWPRNSSLAANQPPSQDTSLPGTSAAGKPAVPPSGANTHSTLAGLQASPSDTLHNEDFESAAAATSAKNKKLDDRYANMAGLPPVGETRIPIAEAEQFALGSLAHVIETMDELAGKFAVPTTTALLSGKPENMAQLQLHIDKFLAQAQKTLTDFVDKITQELPEPLSDQMSQALRFAKVDLWKGLEQMQASIHRAFRTPVTGPDGPALPDDAQRSDICRHFRDAQVQAFQSQISLLQVGRKQNKSFSASQLAGVVAMQAELKAAQALVELQFKGRPAKPPRDVAATFDHEPDFGMDTDKGDGDEDSELDDPFVDPA